MCAPLADKVQSVQGRVPGRTGVWVRERKLGAVGVRISHGMAELTHVAFLWHITLAACTCVHALGSRVSVRAGPRAGAHGRVGGRAQAGRGGRAHLAWHG